MKTPETNTSQNNGDSAADTQVEYPTIKESSDGILHYPTDTLPSL